jgi:putative DNA primase/helicase
LEENKVISGSIRDEALYLVSLGWPIIPLCSPTHKGMKDLHMSKCKSPGKSPLIKDWVNWSATTKEDVINWFRSANQSHANINIGMPLGNPSGMIGLDVDGQEGEVILLAISNGDIPPTLEFSTGNGRRLLYKLPNNMTTKKFKFAGRNGTHTGFEILTTGQQSVIPPSVHANGTVYRWKAGHSPRDIPLAECPQWVLEKIDASNTEIPITSAPVTEDDWHRVLKEGERNDGITRRVGSEIAKNRTKEQVLTAALAYNRNYCEPPLEEREVVTIVESIFLREEMNKSKQSREVTTQKPQKPVLRPTPFIKHFLMKQKEQGYVWKYSAEMGVFFRCDENEGPWKLLDIDYVKSYLRKILIDTKQGGSITFDSQRNTNECVEAMKAELVVPGEFDIFDLGSSIKNRTWEHNPMDIVCLQNGVYNWREKALLPWTSRIYTTVKLPISYDPNMDCPYWKQALSDWIPSEETRNFLQEFTGLCLIPDTSFRTAVFLYGSGSNGKSMFLDVFHLLFGEALVSIPLHRLAERFETAYLQNKLVNICGDIDAKYIAETGIIKTIITGDKIHAEFKHGKQFDFTPVVRLMFSSNTLPPVADKTHAWYTRWKYVKFPRTFPVNPTYKLEYEKIFEKEASGILNWALEGLIRLKENNKWTESEDMIKSEVEYRSENDNVAAFLQDFVETSDLTSDCVPTSVLHRCYKDWLERYMTGTRGVSMVEFSKRVQTYGYTKNIRTFNGKSTNVFLGMRPKVEVIEDYKTYLSIGG